MCVNCGFPTAPGHWTEAGLESSADRIRARFKRAELLRAILRTHGLTAYDDGVTPGISIATLTGNHTTAENLTQVWEVVERLTGSNIDPLDPQFLGSQVSPVREVHT